MPFLKNYFVPKKSAAQGITDPSNASGSAPTGMQPSRLAGSHSDPDREMQWTSHEGGSSSGDALSRRLRPGSLYPEGDFRNAGPDAVKDIKCEVMVNWLHSKQEERIWTTGEPGEGVVLKKAKGRYVCCPSELLYDSSQFYQMIARLNVRVCSINRLVVVFR